MHHFPMDCQRIYRKIRKERELLLTWIPCENGSKLCRTRVSPPVSCAVRHASFAVGKHHSLSRMVFGNENSKVSSEIFACGKCEINPPHTRRYFTSRSDISHAERISQIPQRFISLKKDDCFRNRLFSGWDGWIRTSE